MSYNAQLHRRAAFGFCCKCDIRFTEVGAAHEHGIRCCRRGSLHLEEITMWSGCEKRRRPRRRNGRTDRRLLRRRRRLLAAATTAPTARAQAKGNPKERVAGERAHASLFTLVAHKEPHIMRDLCATCFYASTSIVRLYFIDQRFGVRSSRNEEGESGRE